MGANTPRAARCLNATIRKQMTDKTLIVHIGSGKTGSSSIQLTMAEQRETMEAAGFHYLGILLEYADAAPSFEWRKRGGSALFFMQGEAKSRSDELYEALSQEIGAASPGTTLIWSNEWLFGRHERVLPVLARLAEDGVSIRVVCYVRRHDRWAVSAYKQWALKNKTNEGRIQSFSEWFPRTAHVFYPSLKPWADNYGKALELFNFDTVGDVSKHFIDLLALPEGVEPLDDNVSPGDEVLALWALYNNKFDGPVPPRFERLLQQLVPDTARTMMPPLHTLLPSLADLEALQHSHAADAQALNALLVERGQPQFDDAPPKAVANEIDPWRMTCLLASMVTGLNERLQNQQRQIMDLRKRLDAIGKKG